MRWIPALGMVALLGCVRLSTTTLSQGLVVVVDRLRVDEYCVSLLDADSSCTDVEQDARLEAVGIGALTRQTGSRSDAGCTTTRFCGSAFPESGNLELMFTDSSGTGKLVLAPPFVERSAVVDGFVRASLPGNSIHDGLQGGSTIAVTWTPGDDVMRGGPAFSVSWSTEFASGNPLVTGSAERREVDVDGGVVRFAIPAIPHDQNDRVAFMTITVPPEADVITCSGFRACRLDGMNASRGVILVENGVDAGP